MNCFCCLIINILLCGVIFEIVDSQYHGTSSEGLAQEPTLIEQATDKLSSLSSNSDRVQGKMAEMCIIIQSTLTHV